MTRRWAPSNITLSTTRYRVVQGIKSPDDLRLERFDNGRWMPVFMEEVFLMADFFHENEGALNPYRPYWRESGGTYFLKEVIDAARNGWTAPTSRLRENRRRKEAS
jgi:hypothetical protein